MGCIVSRRAFLAAATAALARAQNLAKDANTFSTDVKVVSVLAMVRDKQGKIVTNLTKDDFDLSEDGRPQTIKYFSRETDLPLTLGLLVDTSGSQRQVLGEERSASREFIEKVLREDRDQTFLIHFDKDTELLPDQRPQLSRRGSGYPEGGNAGGAGDPGGRGGGARGRGARTTLYDAILL